MRMMVDPVALGVLSVAGLIVLYTQMYKLAKRIEGLEKACVSLQVQLLSNKHGPGMRVISSEEELNKFIEEIKRMERDDE